MGDPSGRSTERNALAPSELNSNIKAITAQLTSFLSHGVPFAQSRTRRRGDSPIGGSAGAEAEGGSFAGQLGREKGGVRIENNLDWLGGMGLLKFLSTVGKTARMSTMLSRERFAFVLVVVHLPRANLYSPPTASNLASIPPLACLLPSSPTNSSKRSTSSRCTNDTAVPSSSAALISSGTSCPVSR